MSAKRLAWLLLVLAGLAAYGGFFLRARMPSVEEAVRRSAPDGERQEETVFRRGEVLGFLFLPEPLLDSWCGKPPECSLLDRVPLLATAVGIVAWAAALGWLLLVSIRVDRGLSRWECLVFSTAVGLSAISTFVLAMGLCGALRSRMVFLVPAVLTATAAAALWWRRRRPLVPSPPARLPSRERRVGNVATDVGTQPIGPRWLWLAAPFVAMIVLGGMLPPADFDVREYHLQAPKEFYQQGRITFLAHNVYANMPLGAEMFCLLGMAITGDWWLGALVGKTVIALMAPLTALGLWAAGRRFFSPAAGAVAAIVYLSVPWIIRVSAAGLVDAAMGCYLFLAVYAAILATQHKARGLQPPGFTGTLANRLPMVLLAGYLAGGAVSCKYPAVVFVAAPLVFWTAATPLLDAWRLQGPRRWRAALGGACARAGAFALALAIGCGLWFGKNWVLTGNPTYPLLYSTFGGQTWTPEKDRQWSAVHGPREFSLSALGSDLMRVAVTSEWLSPLIVPLAVLALGRRRPWLVWALATYLVLVIVAWWLLTHRIDRFWVPVLPVAALLAGAGACWSTDRVWRWGLGAFLVLGTVYSFLAAGALPVDGNYNRYFVGLDRARLDRQRLGAAHWHLNRAARGGRVLLVGDAEPFDLEMPVLYNTCFDDSIFEQLVKDRSPEQVRAALAERQVAYVFVHWSEVRRYRATYGFSPFVQPEVFDRLVGEGILRPERGAPFPAQMASLYRVVGPGEQRGPDAGSASNAR